MVNTYRIDEDNMLIEALRDAKKALTIAERAGKADQYFLLCERYDALIRNTDGVERNEGLYIKGRDAVAHRARAEELLNDNLVNRI